MKNNLYLLCLNICAYDHIMGALTYHGKVLNIFRNEEMDQQKENWSNSWSIVPENVEGNRIQIEEHFFVRNRKKEIIANIDADIPWIPRLSPKFSSHMRELVITSTWTVILDLFAPSLRMYSPRWSVLPCDTFGAYPPCGPVYARDLFYTNARLRLCSPLGPCLFLSFTS